MRPVKGRTKQPRIRGSFPSISSVWLLAFSSFAIATIWTVVLLAMGHRGLSKLLFSAPLWTAITGFVVALLAVLQARTATLQARTATSAQVRDRFGSYLKQRQEAVEGLISESIIKRENSMRALVDLADEYADKRQDVIDSLCSFLRESLRSDPSDDEKRLWRAATMMIRDRLQPRALNRWDCCKIDLTGAVIEGGDLSGVDLTSVTLKLNEVTFLDGTTTFAGAMFGRRSHISFDRATFASGTVCFDDVCLGTEATVSFEEAKFISGHVSFNHARFYSKNVSFREADFLGSCLDFSQVARWHERPIFDFTTEDAPIGIQWPPPFNGKLERVISNSWATLVTDQIPSDHLRHLRSICGLPPDNELIAYIVAGAGERSSIFFSSEDVRFVGRHRRRNVGVAIPFDSLHQLEANVVVDVVPSWSDQGGGSDLVQYLKISYCGNELMTCQFEDPHGNLGTREILERIKEIAKESR